MKEEKQYTFTITEDDLKRPHSGPHLKSIKYPGRSLSYSEGDLRKYQTLPPIGNRYKWELAAYFYCTECSRIPPVWSLIDSLIRRHMWTYRLSLFADFSKGFDLVDHNVLTEELKHVQASACYVK